MFAGSGLSLPSKRRTPIRKAEGGSLKLRRLRYTYLWVVSAAAALSAPAGLAESAGAGVGAGAGAAAAESAVGAAGAGAGAAVESVIVPSGALSFLQAVKTRPVARSAVNRNARVFMSWSVS